MDFVKQAVSNIYKTAQRKFNDNEGIFRANRQVVLPQAISRPIQHYQDRAKQFDDFYQKAPLASGIYNPIRQTAINALDFAKMDPNTDWSKQAGQYGKALGSTAQAFAAIRGAKALGAMKPLQLAITGTTTAGLGAGISKLTGGDFKTGATQGLNTLPSILGVGQLTNPIINRIAGKAGQAIVSRLNGPLKQTLANQVIERGVTGLLNVPEGMMMRSAMGQPYDVRRDAPLDIFMGAVLGKPAIGGVKALVGEEPKISPALAGLDMNRIKNLMPEELKVVRDLVKSNKIDVENATSARYLLQELGMNPEIDDRTLRKTMQGINEVYEQFNPRQINYDNPLLQEARKFDTLEEFVRGQTDLSRPVQPTFTKATVPIDRIKSLGTEGSYDPTSYEYSLNQLKNGKQVIPIEVRLEDGKYHITDGEHRFKAYKELGIKEIPIKIEGGPITKSQLTDIYNQAHGQPTTIPGSRRSHPKPPEELFGGVAGVEPYQDENGKWQIRYDPVKGAMGVVGMTAVGKYKNGLKNAPTQQAVADKQIESIIQEGRKSIGKPADKSGKSIRQVIDTLYTQWVDRFHPISQASNQAKKQLKAKGAVLRPEYDPEVLVRRLTGAGSIADAQYRRELKPIIDKLEQFGISKDDMDVYLAHKRMAGFGDVGREVYGSDPVKSQNIINAIETKYGESIKSVADELYSYQDKALKELSDSGFLSPQAVQAIKSQNPDYSPLYRVMDEMDNYLGVPTRKTMQGTSPIEKIKGSDRQIVSPVESIIANTFRNRAAIEKNRVAKSIVGLQQISPDLGFKKVGKEGYETITTPDGEFRKVLKPLLFQDKDVIIVWNNGKKEAWKVGEEIASTAKGLNEENMNTLLKIFTVPASLLRQGATGRNPEFMIPNIIRDQLDASITSKYGYIPFVDYVSGLKSMLTKDDIYRKWEGSGAKIDLGEMSGRKSIQASFDTVKKKKRLIDWLGKTLDTMGKYSEQPTRIGLFKKAYKKTGNEMMSMMESRDATVDFARMGSKMKVANSIIPFLNVGVQGFDKLIRATRNNPAKVATLGALYGVLPSVSATLYNIMYHPQEYAEVPQYDKDANFVFIKGRNENGTVDYFTIPKGNVIPLIANPAEHFLSYMAGQDSESFAEFATKFITSALPVIGDGATPKEVAIKTIGSNLPQLIKPATEALMNKSFYKYDPKRAEAKEIVPSYLKSKPGYQQDYEFTPKMYKAIGAVLNVSPLQIKNTMEGYLAGYTKIPAQVIEVMSNLSEGKPTSPNDITLLRRFMKQTYETGAPKDVTRPDVPPLMERITGKASASNGETDTVTREKQYKQAKRQYRSGLTDSEKKAEDSYEKYSIKLSDYNKTQDPKAGSSLYYSVKNSKSLTPEMRESLLESIPVPPVKEKSAKKLKAKGGSKAKKGKKGKKITALKIKKVAIPKGAKLSIKSPKLAKLKGLTSKSVSAKVAKIKPQKLNKLTAKVNKPKKLKVA